MSERFSMVQRVRFGDLDAMQHMNNVEFLRFFETARIAFIQQHLPRHTPTRRGDFGFIFAECHIAYRAPAFFDEEIRTYIDVGEIRRSSVKLHFEMRSESDERLVAEGWGTLVGYDYAEARPEPLPDDVRAVLEAQSPAEHPR